MRTNSIKRQLIQNICMVQEIHSVIHQILDHELKEIDVSRKRWTQAEDQLLKLGMELYTDVDTLAKIVVSKTKAQIYFRVRYLRERQERLDERVASIQAK
ncbi:Hypothetical_protein [Hexamita inflata]|uniref:Hypothetical_protein n=1 Tax=Hexamita inflata TaxID=28002 RepID=A0AA86U688_9EUKA|nr:Hypothetical protein HINF_LOCUS32077 [Hexamita inflata]CAI9944440.1 Hypothetical protein HINF_LOCUS32085 [Hexamita inflata]